MSFCHLVRIGRRRVNPWFVIEVDDEENPRDLTMFPGRTIRLDADEAADVRRLLGEADRTRAVGGDANGGGVPAPPRPYSSGYSPTHSPLRPAAGDVASLGE